MTSEVAGGPVDAAALLAALRTFEGLPGVGVDVESIARFATPDPRLFTAAELAHCAAAADPAECRAGRWCAKEAVMKACAAHLTLALREIEVTASADGRPIAVLPERARAMGLSAEVSIAHAGSLAVAVAVAGRTGTR